MPYSVEIRGEVFEIEHPTDFHIRTIEEFVKTPVSDRRRQKELANGLQSMIPSLPVEWASVREFELPDGTNEVKVTFNLQTYELLEVTRVSAIAWLEDLIAQLKAAKPKDNEESARIQNKIASLQKVLDKDLEGYSNPVLAVLDNEVGDSVVSKVDAIRNEDLETAPQQPDRRAGFSKPQRRRR